ncbi:MAG TPA: hypothetical protein VNH18_08515, partial [Bryobacteraceae bacterium]|nr:hypothetical protein [Bryobacteraceae bacterium]
RIGLAPFLGNIVTRFGILNPAEEALGFRPGTIPLSIRVGLTWLVLLSSFACVRLGGGKPSSVSGASEEVFAIFSGAYALLLLPGAFVVLTYDRYMLPLFPLLIIVVLLRFKARVRSVPAVAWACLALFAVYSVTTTHDYYSGLRARVLAADNLQQLGIARSQISVGFAYDGWTQLQLTGKIRPILYRESFEWNTTDKFWFWAKTPALSHEYVVSYWKASSLPAGAIVTVPFSGWLPPFRRAVVVLKQADLPRAQ